MTMHNGLVDQATRFKKRIASIDTSTYKVVDRGQLVVSFPIDEGVLDFQLLYEQAIVSPAYGIWELSDSTRVDHGYLKRALRSPLSMSYYRQKLRGSTARRRSLPMNDFLGLPLHLPPIEEQRAIASILDEADLIRTKRRAQLAHFDEIPQSLFHETFGALSADAVVTDLLAEQKGSIRTGPFGSQLLHGEFVNEGIAVLGLDNVVGNTFKWAKRRFITSDKYTQLHRYTVYPRDVLISIMGTVGRCVVVPDEIETAINTKHICAITLNHDAALPEFVRAAFLWHPTSRRYLAHETKGAIMAGLNMGIIKSMPLPLPPLADQQAFTEKMNAICTERDRVARALETDDELFAALQHRAFRGEL